jgi:hypothetical protein
MPSKYVPTPATDDVMPVEEDDLPEEVTATPVSMTTTLPTAENPGVTMIQEGEGKRKDAFLKKTSGTRGDDVTLSLSEDAADDPCLDLLEDKYPKYVEMVRRALIIEAGEGFHEIEEMDILRVAQDKKKRPVFIFLPAHLPAGVDLDMVMLYVFCKLHKPVVREEKRYQAFWMCNNGDSPSRLTLRWFRRVWRMTPYEYHYRLVTLAVVHPPIHVRLNMSLFGFAQMLGCTRFSLWDKVDFVDRIEFLEHYVKMEVIKSLPDDIKRHDVELEEELYERITHGNSYKFDPMEGAGPVYGFGQHPDGLNANPTVTDDDHGYSTGAPGSKMARAARTKIPHGGSASHRQLKAQAEYNANYINPGTTAAEDPYGSVSDYSVTFGVPKRRWED